MSRHANHCHEYWRLSPSLCCWVCGVDRVLSTWWVLSTPSSQHWAHVASHWDGVGWCPERMDQGWKGAEHPKAGAALSQAGRNYPQQGNVEGNVCHLQQALHTYQCFKTVKLSRRPWLTCLHRCLSKALALALSSLFTKEDSMELGAQHLCEVCYLTQVPNMNLKVIS